MGFVRLHEIAQPEIDQLDGAVIFITYEKNIFGLDVAMANPRFVTMIYTTYDLLEVFFGHWLWKSVVILELVEKIAPETEFHDQI